MTAATQSICHRFGASTLVNDVPMQIAKLTDGNYQSGEYFSLPRLGAL